MRMILFFSMVSLLVRVDAAEALRLEKSTVLEAGRTYGALVIAASGITVDGGGEAAVGTTAGEAKNYTGTGVTMVGLKGVTLRKLVARGWETGLRMVDCEDCVIEGCTFSDNFHDPKFGWGEQGRRGGIVLEGCRGCTLRRNVAQRVWDGCVLSNADGNRLEGNDFSHTSNTCLKLWNASRNTVEGNTLSYGIRIDPGEVHARDSTSVLLESGSNENVFTRNDCSHGGDGIFIRVLNGWVSTGNVFTENDCSFANNNCVEAWSPRNTWVRNVANHGSYGFWLGASDGNVLVENEASFNGLAEGHHNSPHLPEAGHAGIVFMFGPSSHTVLRGNRCVGNHGAGIAGIGDLDSGGKKWRAFHWIMERNLCTQNRWGIYLQHAEEIVLAGNVLQGNEVADVFHAGDVLAVHELREAPGEGPAPQAVLRGPTTVQVGEAAEWSAAESLHVARYRWCLRSGVAGAMEPKNGTGATFAQTFAAPGFYRLALTVEHDQRADLAWRDVYVVEPVREVGTEGNAADWSWEDPQSKVKFSDDTAIHLSGKTSLHAAVSPYSGGRVTLRLALHGELPKLEDHHALVFWIKTRNEGTPAWQDVNPLITLHDANGKTLTLTPAGDFLSQLPYNEAREGWAYFIVPLAGNADWKRSGEPLTFVQGVDLGFDSWGAPPLHLWLDGLGWK